MAPKTLHPQVPVSLTLKSDAFPDVIWAQNPGEGSSTCTASNHEVEGFIMLFHDDNNILL